MTPAYLKQKAAAAYLGVSVRYFQQHVTVRPKELPGRGRKPLLVWCVRELDEWVARVSDPKSRPRKAS
ncbi:MAG TPA: hypothetical protein VHB25_04290 [Gemmatimonadaceae bacterium]|nr:hypothetical protein [Gemmatimonadaceae bacterium]